MEDLIKMLTQKVGIPESQAQSATSNRSVFFANLIDGLKRKAGGVLGYHI